MDIFAQLAERKIEEAIAEGKLDNLPGKGKPLQLEENPFIPPELRAMNRILKQNGVLPAWVQLQRDLEAARKNRLLEADRFRESYGRWREELAITASWEVAERASSWYLFQRKAFIDRTESYAVALRHFDAIAPKAASRPARLCPCDERERFDREFPPL